MEQKELGILFEKLSKSGFRCRFRLQARELRYLEQKGLEAMERHAVDFVTDRLAPADPKNDGRQTPMRNHPVFVAQHATGTCCRKCLQKWHQIPPGSALGSEQIDYIVAVIMYWIENFGREGIKPGGD